LKKRTKKLLLNWTVLVARLRFIKVCGFDGASFQEEGVEASSFFWRGGSLRSP
jgi:hypothetical protein